MAGGGKRVVGKKMSGKPQPTKKISESLNTGLKKKIDGNSNIGTEKTEFSMNNKSITDVSVVQSSPVSVPSVGTPGGVQELFEQLDAEAIDEYRNGHRDVARDNYEQIASLFVKTRDQEGRAFLADEHERMTHSMSFFERKGKLRIAIVGFEVSCVGKWDPTNAEKGITGSEEAVIYSSLKLAEMGHDITVFCDPPHASPYSLPLSNPCYVQVSEFTEHKGYGHDYSKVNFDIVVLWRKSDFNNYSSRGKVYFWPHDNPRSSFPITGLSGCFFLSNFQRNTYVKMNPELEKVPYIICGNGIVPDQFEARDLVKANPYSCIYSSSYAWGLTTLINIWPDIRKEFPTATLKIFYGRQNYGFLTEEQMAVLVKKIKVLESQGVEEVGKVDHYTLAREMCQASILAYPANVTETFSITMVKAQAAGMIPVTTRMGALKETACPSSAFMKGLCEDNESKFMIKVSAPEYKELLLSTMRNIESYNRQTFVDWSMQFTWEQCVNKWLDLHSRTKSLQV